MSPIAAAASVSVLSLLFAKMAHSAEIASTDSSFTRAFLTDHSAFILPIQGTFNPGDVVDSEKYRLQASLADCVLSEVTGGAPSLMSDYAGLSVEAAYRNSSWQTNMTVSAGSRPLSGTVQTEVSRTDSVEETRGFSPSSRRLEVSREFGSRHLRAECVGFYESTDGRVRDGKWLVLDELIYLTGEVRFVHQLKFSGDANASISTDSFLEKAKKISWLAPILNSFQFKTSVDLGGNVVRSDLRLVRYPEVRENKQPTAIGFRPRNIRIWIAEKILTEVQRLEPEFSEAMATNDAASSFLVRHPELDVRGEESLLTQLFGSGDGAPYTTFLEEFDGAKSHVDAISKVIEVNIKAERFKF